MAAKRLSLLTLSAIAFVAALAAWLTRGALTLTSLSTDGARIGLLQSPGWLVAWLAAAFAVLLISRTSRSRLLVLSAVLVAPWLPGYVPAAAFIWTGPLRDWLWIVIIVAVTAPAAARRAPANLASAVRDPRRAPWLAAAIAAVAYLAGAYQISPRLPTGDEPHYLVIAQSLLKDHDLKIENNHRRGDYHDYYAGDLRPDYLQRGINGEIYSVHAPGLPVVVAPVFALFGYPGVLVFLALVSAWATALAWMATWRVTSDAASSWFGWATAALTAPFFFQSFVVYPDAPGAALLMIGVLALVGEPTLSTRRALVTGAALAILPWLHTRYVVAAVVLGMLIAARAAVSRPNTGALRRILSLFSVPLVSAVCWFCFFYAIYGSPDPRAPYGGSAQSDLANLPRGIIGLLFDQQFGVLPSAPVLLCALAGLVVLLRRTPRMAVELILLIAPYGFLVGAFQMWWGGNSSPGRFITPIMLPLAIPAGVWFHTRRGYAGKFLGLGALTISLLTTITLATVDRGILLYNFRDGSSRLLTWLSPLVNITAGMPSVFQTDPSTALLHGLVWIAAIALTAAAGVFVERRGGAPVSVALALGLSAVAFATVALSVVWWHHGLSLSGSPDPASPITPASGTAAFLDRYDPDSRQIAIRYGPMRPVSLEDVLSNLTLAETMGPATRDAPAIAVFRVPAGLYAIEGEGHGTDPLTVTVDSEFGPQWKWDLDEPSGTWRREFRLPVQARGVAVMAPGASRVALRPINISGSRSRIARTEAAHVARYGPAVVFVMAGHAFMERAGTWVEGGRSAEFAISADHDAPVQLLVRNPPVANTVLLEATGWREQLILAPGEERLIALPLTASSGAVALRVSAAQGARPTEFERGSEDSRYLGCWIETRP
jgi:hypothetical protein